MEVEEYVHREIKGVFDSLEKALKCQRYWNNIGWDTEIIEKDVE